MTQLSDALFTKTQQQILGLLYGQPHQSFYMKEILRLTGMGVATVKRELDRMLSAEIIDLEKIGNQHHYQANPHCPIYHELLSIVKKTMGIAWSLQQALKPYEASIYKAFIYGSIANGTENQGSDIDLMVIGNIKFSDLIAAIYPLQEELGREINPRIFQLDEWNQMLQAKDIFAATIMEGTQIHVLGGTNDLKQFNRD